MLSMSALAVACPTCSSSAFRPGTPRRRPLLSAPEHAVAVVAPLLTGRDREHCLLLSLDTRNRLLRISTISVGSARQTFMAPREVFREALLHGASAVVLAHNHPSGDPTPSVEDREATRRILHAGAMLGIAVLDHVVIGDGDWASLSRLGGL